MINKTIKTIAYLLAGLTLSACVGSVNVPSNDSDNASRAAESGGASGAITIDDLQTASNSLFNKNDEGNHYSFTNDLSQQSWTGLCTGTGACKAYYPNTIDITPLADNTGTATYSGSIHLQFNNLLDTTTDRVTNATFKVNFDEHEILYDGTIGDFSLQVRADFTPRGLITGTLSLDRDDSYLLGVIGQTEMVGSFVAPFNFKNGSFAGGFTASRD